MIFTNPYYAFVEAPPIPGGTFTVAVSPVVELTREVRDTGSVLEPLYRRSCDAEKAVSAGAVPSSFQVTVMALPAGRDAPGAGEEKTGTADAKGARVARQRRAPEKRMATACALCAKRVTCSKACFRVR